MIAEYTKLEGVVSAEGGEIAVQLRLHYRLPDQRLSILTGPEMSGFAGDFVPTAVSLSGAARAFLEDAVSDLAIEGVTLDSDEPRDGFVIAYDDAARRVLGLPHEH